MRDLRGLIICRPFSDPDEQVCVNAKKQMLQTKNQPEEIVEEDRSVELNKPSSIDKARARVGNNPKQTKTPVSKPTKDPSQRSAVQKKLSTSSMNPLSSPPPQFDDMNHVEDYSAMDSPLERSIGSTQRDHGDLPFEENVHPLATSIAVDEDNDNDYLLQEIQKLTLKVKEQCQIIKDRDNEIKRLKSTTISSLLHLMFASIYLPVVGMPTDEAARGYILYLANRIQHSSNGFKYNGNLTVDAKRLGISLAKLNESLNAKNLIATTARDLFKKMIPESERQVDHWNQLKPDVLMKEKILLSMGKISVNTVSSFSFDLLPCLDFLERYYGPLEVDQKKLHTSLVGCLRNQRSVQKKRNQQTSVNLDNGHDLNIFELE